MSRVWSNMRFKQFVAGFLVVALTFSLLPNTQVLAEEPLHESLDLEVVAATEEPAVAPLEAKDSSDVDAPTDMEAPALQEPLVNEEGPTQNIGRSATIYSDETLADPVDGDECRTKIWVEGNVPEDAELRAWPTTDVESKDFAWVFSYELQIVTSDQIWEPEEAVSLLISDESLNGARKSHKHLVALVCNGEGVTECALEDALDSEGNVLDGIACIRTQGLGAIVVGVPLASEQDALDQPDVSENVQASEPAQADVEAPVTPVTPDVPSETQDVVQNTEAESHAVTSSMDELLAKEPIRLYDALGTAGAVVARPRMAAASLLSTESSDFTPTTLNGLNYSINNKTTVPVCYVFANGEVVSGEAIGFPTSLVSGAWNTAANLKTAGIADSHRTTLAAALKAATTATSTVTTDSAYLNDLTTKVAYVYNDDSSIYYTKTYYSVTNDTHKNQIINEVNSNKYQLEDEEKILIKVSLANYSGQYTQDGISYTTNNGSVTATATSLNADTYGSSDLPPTVAIAGVPFTVVDNITSYTKDGVTYTLDRTHHMVTSPTVSLDSLNELQNGLYVNGVFFAFKMSGQVTYKGVTYTVDTSGSNGATTAKASAYRAATIGEGTKRSDVPATEYGGTTEPTVTRSVIAHVPLSKTLSTSESVSNTKTALKAATFSFLMSQDESNPQNGATILLTSGEAGDSTVVSFSVSDLLERGTNAGDATNATYTLDGDNAPWTITFTKAGTYRFTVHEIDTGAEGVEYDSHDVVFTYYVVEEAGSLRLSEAFKTEGDQVEPTKISDATPEALQVDHLFNTSYDLGTVHRLPPTITQDGNVIEMNLNQDTSGVITTQFTFDFSRSFEIEGKFRMPDSDAVAIAFHGQNYLNAYRWNCNNAIDNFHYGNGNQAAELTILRYGYIPPNTDLTTGFLFNIITRNLDDLRGWYAYKVENNVRMPYEAASGLNGDVYNVNKNIAGTAKSYESFKNEWEATGVVNEWSIPFKISFVCEDSERGYGTLTIELRNDKNTSLVKTVVFDNFCASDILGEDAWQNAHFSIGSSVQDGDKGGLRFTSERYMNEAISSVSTSFWADRNNDGLYETQVNTTNSLAVPGESILVRHTIQRSDSTSNPFYEKVLVRQVTDITNGQALSPTSLNEVVSYPTDDIGKAVQASNVAKASFNSNSLSNAMIVKVFANANTNLEYKITAPAAGHTVAESALFGQPPFPSVQTESYGFRTEKDPNPLPSFHNAAQILPVCKIVDGTKTNIFFSLKDAVDFADAAANGLAGKDVTIQMLVPVHTIGEAILASHGNKKITITTASRSDSTYPYRGEEGTQAKLVRGFSGESIITSTSSLELNNLTFDGASEKFDGGQAGGFVLTKKSSSYAAPTLVLSGSTHLTNSRLSDEDADKNAASGGGALYIGENCSLTMGDNVRIDSCSAHSNGGAISTGTKTSVTLEGNVVIQGCSAMNMGGAIYVNNNTKLIVGGSCLIGTLSDDDDALGNTAGSTGGGIHSAQSDVTIKENASISGNVSAKNGGGINSTGGNKYSLTIEGNATVSRNRAGGNGGGICIPGGLTVNLTGSSIDANSAAGNGGGIYIAEKSIVNVSAGFSIAGNTATADGGGIYAKNCTLNFASGSKIGGAEEKGNKARNGGGIVLGGSAVMNMPGGMTISYNEATLNGGGVYLTGGNTLSVNTGDVIECNNATQGGGVYLKDAERNVSVVDGSVINNEAYTNGGGVFIEPGATLAVGGATRIQNNVVVAESAGGIASNVYLPGASSSDGSKAGGILLVTSNLTGSIGIYAADGAHDGLVMTENEQFARTQDVNTAYSVADAFTNDRNVDSKVVLSTTDDHDIEWEREGSKLTVTHVVEGQYADLTKDFTITLQSAELKGLSLEADVNGTSQTVSFDDGGKASIRLKHNETFVMEGLSKTTQISFGVEDEAYQHTYDYKVGSASKVTGQSSCTITITEDSEVTIHNVLDSVPATGVTDNARAWGAVASAALVGMAALWLRRRRQAA